VVPWATHVKKFEEIQMFIQPLKLQGLVAVGIIATANLRPTVTGWQGVRSVALFLLPGGDRFALGGEGVATRRRGRREGVGGTGPKCP